MNKISFKTLYHLIVRHKSKLIWANIIALLATLVSIPIPLLIPLLVDEVLLKKPAFLIENINYYLGEYTALGYIVITLFVTIFLRFSYLATSIFSHYIFSEIAQNVSYSLRKKILLHLEKVSMNEYETLGSGSVSSKLVTDMQTVESFIGSALSRSIVSILTLIGVAIVLLMIDWKLGTLILILQPAITLVTQVISRRVAKYKKEENRLISRFQNSLIETLDLFGQIKASSKEEFFIGQSIDNAKRLRFETEKFNKKSFASERFSFTLFLSVFELFRALGLVMVVSSSLSIGLMFAVFGYLWFMMTPVQDLIALQYAFANAKSALQRLNKLLDLEIEHDISDGINPFIDKSGSSIEVKNLSFSYNGGSNVLKHISFNIKSGSKVAFIGASGSGKTTLAKLLSAFYVANSGKLFFNGVELSQIGLHTLRENLFVVLQQPILFNDTLRFNLTMGDNFSNEQINRALSMAQLISFVDLLPDGLDSLVGKNGVRLSGGQKQRLSIARMILTNPKIVIFDESTSALDVHTESELFSAIDEFLQERTVIVIAHRLSTVQSADYIYVLSDGRIVEEGSPNDLLENEGHYSKFVMAQH